MTATNEIVEAMDTLDERKRAVFGIDGDVAGGGNLDELHTRLMLAGFDLDAQDVALCAQVAAGVMAGNVSAGFCSIPDAFKGLWFDGLITGLMIAQRRAQGVIA